MQIHRRNLLAGLCVPLLTASVSACGGGGGGGSSSASSSSASSSAGTAVIYTGGTEFIIETQVANSFRHSNPIGLSNGHIVTGWTDTTVVGDRAEVRAQIYTSAGARIGNVIAVNTQTSDQQQEPAAAPLANGGFVFVWADSYALEEPDPTLSLPATPADDFGGVRAQVFDANGVKSGSEIRVNTSLPGLQRGATVAGLVNGNFVVTWQDSDGDSDDDAVKAQMFNAAGVAIGTEFLVNTNTTSFQTRPAISALTGGGFVIVWHDNSQTLGDTSRLSVKAQLFDAAANRIGGEFLVNTTTAEQQWFATVTGLSGGGFAVTWEDTSLMGGDASIGSVKAQVFTATGTKIGAEFLVNTNTMGNQFSPSIAALPDNAFVITWQDNSQTLGDTAVSIIKAQVFTGMGAKSGDEFLVNTPSADTKIYPFASPLATGGFVIAWKEFSGILLDPASSEKTKARVYTPT